MIDTQEIIVQNKPQYNRPSWHGRLRQPLGEHGSSKQIGKGTLSVQPLCCSVTSGSAFSVWKLSAVGWLPFDSRLIRHWFALYLFLWEFVVFCSWFVLCLFVIVLRAPLTFMDGCIPILIKESPEFHENRGKEGQVPTPQGKDKKIHRSVGCPQKWSAPLTLDRDDDDDKDNEKVSLKRHFTFLWSPQQAYAINL